jgi:transposase InsO family protein
LLGRKGSNPVLGYGYLHTALDDHSRLAYTEILPDERKDTAAAFLARACAWYTAAGITIERVLSDNGSCHRSRTWAAACAQLAITPKRTRPYWPQTNGKVERYHRTLADEWAYARPYATETERRARRPPTRKPCHQPARGSTASAPADVCPVSFEADAAIGQRRIRHYGGKPACDRTSSTAPERGDCHYSFGMVSRDKNQYHE